MFNGFFQFCIAKPNLIPLKPTYLVALMLISSVIFMMFIKSNYLFLRPKVNYWNTLYLILFLTWFVLFDMSYDKAEFITLLLSIFSVYIFVVFLSFDDDNHTYSRRGILFATLLTIGNNVYEFIDPVAFFSLDSEIGIPGRSAGFIMNPTICGLVLNVGMILSVSIVPARLRSLFIYMTFIAVLLTFSRSAILGWVLIFMCFNYTKIVELKKTLLYLGVIISTFITFLPLLISYIETEFTAGSSNLILRLKWFMDPAGNVDESESERGMVALKAWNMFLDHPYVGNGLGSTVNWDYTVSTHNIYLTTLAEYGFIGIFIIPLLIYSAVYGASKNLVSITLPFAVSCLFIGFFTHNLLTNLFFLYACCLISLMSLKNSNKHPIA